MIVRHPDSACVPANHKVTLRVRAEGKGILEYQWFTDGAEEVREFNSTHKKVFFELIYSSSIVLFKVETTLVALNVPLP